MRGAAGLRSGPSPALARDFDDSAKPAVSDRGARSRGALGAGAAAPELVTTISGAAPGRVRTRCAGAPPNGVAPSGHTAQRDGDARGCVRAAKIIFMIIVIIMIIVMIMMIMITIIMIIMIIMIQEFKLNWIFSILLGYYDSFRMPALKKSLKY